MCAGWNEFYNQMHWKCQPFYLIIMFLKHPARVGVWLWVDDKNVNANLLASTIRVYGHVLALHSKL